MAGLFAGASLRRCRVAPAQASPHCMKGPATSATTLRPPTICPIRPLSPRRESPAWNGQRHGFHAASGTFSPGGAGEGTGRAGGVSSPSISGRLAPRSFQTTEFGEMAGEGCLLASPALDRVVRFRTPLVSRSFVLAHRPLRAIRGTNAIPFSDFGSPAEVMEGAPKGGEILEPHGREITLKFGVQLGAGRPLREVVGV